ncbi:Protein of unknown function [Lactobacillus helveticus CIRM-BIA 104]|uniref:Uncharacterized protein n=1 Tax=Lactobacillus helveticus CIRM-BIA 104 TaxID=1226333 RepID=U6F886_LACHE|nr:Protein of unknown function [Lactobacillus helveticus CIRM-BIA 104]
MQNKLLAEKGTTETVKSFV